MNPPITDLAKTSSAALTAQELLQQSPTILLGVGQDAATELAKVGIRTVFDLASSTVFATARKLALPPIRHRANCRTTSRVIWVSSNGRL